jgi:Asp-tRNA(Asn)/Glu-tRNA(Gln) amidotransferase A subunit family amidase
VPRATGTDTAGSLRIPSAECGTSTIKPTRGPLSIRGIVRSPPTFDHPGPMARELGLRAAARGNGRRAAPAERRPLRAGPSRRGSPTSTRTSPTASSRALAALPGERVEAPAPEIRLSGIAEFFDLVLTDMLVLAPPL